MINQILTNNIYLMASYFIFAVPIFALTSLRLLRTANQNIECLEGSFFRNFFTSYAIWSIVTLFAASLAYLILMTNSKSNYFYIHFFLVIPVISLLSSLLITRTQGKKRLTSCVSGLLFFLSVFSLIITFIYMGMKFHL